MKDNKKKYELKSVTHLDIAAEPIQPETLEFIQEMGFPRDSITASYGMAENIVLITSTKGSFPLIHDGFVSCGGVDVGMYNKRIRVVDEGVQSCPDDQVGEIMIQGDDMASGYWNKPIETNETFQNKIEGCEGIWTRTGDLGFIHDDQLYVTGRKKEVIIITQHHCCDDQYSCWS